MRAYAHDGAMLCIHSIQGFNYTHAFPTLIVVFALPISTQVVTTAQMAGQMAKLEAKLLAAIEKGDEKASKTCSIASVCTIS